MCEALYGTWVSFCAVRYIALQCLGHVRNYDTVILKSELCIKLQLSVFIIAGSYCGFLLNTGHVWRTSRDLFLRVHSWNSTRGKKCGDRMDL